MMQNSNNHLNLINSFLAQGNIHKVNELLGFQYQIHGVVIHGNHLGRKLGFPTANLKMPPNTPLQIGYGVYAVIVTFTGNSYPGLVNIGTRPTFNGRNIGIEVNILDFNGNLYGKTLTLSFVDRIRDEKKFDSQNDLTRQIQQDKKEAVKLLSQWY
ncbi:MAG: riboflavin kinase [Bacteroidales bacterium]|nr:riboflavin kinase [Bacteroidales bacterium]